VATEIAVPRAGELLARMAGRRVVVIGDVMIDEWIWGRVSRISPEAPVPVVAVHDHSFTLGGSGNVANNLRALGANVTFVGVVGDDSAGERVRKLFAEIVRRLDGDGLAIDGWYWCPHYDEGCDCRKPLPGLLHLAVREHGLTLDGAAMIGDRGSDVELGQRLGIPGIAVPGPAPYVGPEPDLRANTLLEAVEWIVRRGR
jgi:histidinol-phosphate phosphatase family protein